MRKITQDFIRPFGPRQVSLMLTMAAEMQTYGLTAEDVVGMCREYITGIISVQQPDPIVEPEPVPKEKHFPLCPECGSPIIVEPVNISKCTRVGGEWKSVRICMNAACRFTEMSKLTPAEHQR